MKRSKRYMALLEKFDRTRKYTLREAIELAKELSTAKFDETIEIHVKLGVDPRKADQMVRGTVTLPHGTGKERKVLVLTGGEKEKEALEAGADYVGLDEYIEKIEKGWLDFDAVVATPDAMPKVGKLGRILGPRGLMPNPKTGTVTFDVGRVVREIKKGKIDFKVDRTGVVHAPIGKASFETDKLYENAVEFLRELQRVRPQAFRGTYMKTVHISSTMGPGIEVDMGDVAEIVR